MDGGGLPDYLAPDLDWMLVGINPGLRSAELGHHFAGRGNRFWDLLHDCALVPRKLSYEEDHALPLFGLGLTNIATRPTRSSGELDRRDYAKGRRLLRRKIARYRPRGVAFVGITAYREFQRGSPQDSCAPARPGLQTETVEDARVFVLPNPSGRNAHYSYEEMLRYWKELQRLTERLRASGSSKVGKRAERSIRRGDSR